MHVQTWQTDRNGFITAWMVQGPLVTPYENSVRDPNQLRYEAYLRSMIAAHEEVRVPENLRAGENGRLGKPWQVMCGADCAFVNLSDFYSTMQRVQFDAATVLIAPLDCTVKAVLWSYAAVDVYLRGKKIGGIDAPVYKPIRSCELLLDLKAGENLLYLACETLGVRDTRSVAGLQISSPPTGLAAALPDRSAGEEAGRILAFLEGTRLMRDRLVFPSKAPAGSRMTYRHSDPDLAKCRIPAVWEALEGREEAVLKEGEAYVTLEVPASFGNLRRRFERTEQILPEVIRPVPSFEQNLRLIYQRIADVETLSRGEKFGFPISNMLARQFLGRPSPEDPRLMQEMLELIEMRVDCSDFLMCGLIRYLKNYRVEEAVWERCRQAILNYRYWMDMDGFDGMCFWSENHALMFYASAMHAGDMFPDAWFPRAGMTGKELHAFGRRKVLEWLDDVEENGFEEFLSTVYMCVTFAALINVVDYSEPDISRRASAVTDRLLEMLALHTFKNGIVAPMGRVYRGVLYPFRQGAMALMNMIDPSLPYDFGEGWLGFFATSSYRIPEGLRERMKAQVSTRYVTGNAEIVLEKHEDWCLTSVASPRGPFERWTNICRQADADVSSHLFTKSYNECFHGTTDFQPGTYGYQQHLWYAALDGEAAVFVNHPGSSSEGGDMRPGYWHGNGAMPALRQEGNLLGMIYRIPETLPLHYIHLYAPRCRFEEIRDTGDWLLMRRGRGYIGFWSSVRREPWTGMNTECEERMYGSDTACLVVMGGREYADMDAFMMYCKSLHPAYRGDTLTCRDLTLAYVAGHDDTQYL